MGSFLGHLVPGLVLSLLGLWHIINIIRVYFLNGSTKFIFRFWHPLKSPFGRLERLELILVLSFSVLAAFMQIIDFPNMHFSFKLDNFEHATMFIHLAIFAGFTLSADLSNSLGILLGVSGMLATSVFAQELFLLHYHSTDHVGLEGHYHWLMQLIVCVSFLAALCATSFPGSFSAALVLSISVLLQGCWFINMGFMLWVPKFVAQGCIPQPVDINNSSIHGAVMCETHEADLRARALANLQFSWILSAILMFTSCMCIVFARHKSQTLEYEQLHGRGSHDSPATVEFKQICI